LLILSRQSWSALAELEVQQLGEEGREPEAVAELVERCRREESFDERLWHEGQHLPQRAAWPYDEPSEWEEIIAARPGPVPAFPVDTSRLAERIHGGWLGRCAGCMLGKPVEGRSRQQIRQILTSAGEYPLADYFPPLASVPDGTPYPTSHSPLLRGNITRAERDDDTDYTVLNLKLWAEHAAQLAPEDVASGWLAYLPYHRVYTAERAAYRNLVNEVAPPQSALDFNPYREWIGAQIRADLWGYVAPGQPEIAAELAFRDACVSHTSNGIYGEMFFAALISAALATDDLPTAIAGACQTIPARSRFAEVVANCIEWCKAGNDWERTRDRIEEEYGAYHRVHTLNNAALVLAALLCAEADFGKAICLAVQGGWDTDCNGATAGSVIGALLGAQAIPGPWTEPLNDTLISAVFGSQHNSIAALARQTFELALC